MTLKAYCLFESLGGWNDRGGGKGGGVNSCLLSDSSTSSLRPSTLTPSLSSRWRSSAGLGSHQFHQSLRAHGLGTLQREAQGSAPHLLGQHAQGSGHAEQHRVVVHLSHPVVLQGAVEERSRVWKQCSGKSKCFRKKVFKVGLSYKSHLES